MKRLSGTWPVKIFLNTGVWVSDGLSEGDVMETDEVSEGVVSFAVAVSRGDVGDHSVGYYHGGGE